MKITLTGDPPMIYCFDCGTGIQYCGQEGEGDE